MNTTQPQPDHCPITLQANELLLRMARGDEAALAEFSQAFRRLAFSVLLRLIRDRELAAEIYQDALVKLYRHSASYDPSKGPALAYFQVLLRRTALDRLRRKSRVVFVEDPLILATRDNALVVERSPADDAVAASQIECLKRAIAQLSPALRKPMEALCETGESHGRIAEALQLPLGTVKASIRRAMRILRESLRAEFGLSDGLAAGS